MRCDCHIHIVGPIGRYPQISTRAYQAAEAPLAALKAHGVAARGVTRFVVVQASFYGSDNTLLLESLDALAGDGRGVAVIDPATPEVLLAGFARRGVRGLRLNLYSTAAGREQRQIGSLFTPLAEIATGMGWHVEVIAGIDVLLGAADLLARSRVPVVIDHYGLYRPATPQSERGRALLDFFRLPNVWIKLSAPYRVSDDPLCTRPDPAWLTAIVAAAPNRCVWGSDWPHSPSHPQQGRSDLQLPYRPLSYATLVDNFLTALGHDAAAQAIMIDNPARLYGF
jgi:predicted TIM-barrel fold metal-dependent hydrolase